MNKKIYLIVLVVIVVATTIAVLLYLQLQKEKPQGKEEMKKITLMMPYIPAAEFSPFYCGLDLGYYADENLDVTILHTREGSMEAIKQVGANKSEFGYTKGNSLIVARSSENIPVVVVYQNGKDNSSVIIALKDSGITKPEDLIGKSVAIVAAGSSSYIATKTILVKAGLDYEKVNFVPVGNNEVPMLLQKKVDAMAGHILHVYLLKSMGKEEDINIMYMRDYVNVVQDVVITNEKILKEDPELVRKFVRATDKGFKFAINNPEKAVDTYIKNWAPEAAEKRDFHLGFWKELVNECFRPDKYPLGQIMEEQWIMTQDALYDTNIINKKIDLSKAYTMEFIPK